VRTLLSSSEDIMIPDFLREAKERIREVVIGRLRVFGSSGACALPGNICPTGGNCGTCAVCGTTDSVKSQPPVKEQGGIGSDDIASIVRQVVERVLRENG